VFTHSADELRFEAADTPDLRGSNLTARVIHDTQMTRQMRIDIWNENLQKHDVE
jgi:hypothetical protein